MGTPVPSIPAPMDGYKITSFFYQAAFFMSLAICLAARTAAFAVWIPKKSSNVSLNMLRALMRPTA